MANDNDIVSVTPIAAPAVTPPTVHEDPDIVGVTPVSSQEAPISEAPPPTVATGDQDDILTRGLKQFGGDVAGAAGSTLGLLGNPLNILLNKTGLPQTLTGAPLSEDLGQSAKDIAGGAIGEVKPQNEIDRLSDAITEGGLSSVIGGTGLGNALKNVASPVIAGAAKTLAESPIADLVSGVSGGASQEAARSAGAGPVGQTVAGLVGGGIGGLGAGLAHAGREAPVSDTVVDNTPPAVTPAVQADFNTQLEQLLKSGASTNDLNAFASRNGQRLDPTALAAAVKARDETGQTGGVVVKNPEAAPSVPQATPDAIQSGDEGQQIREVTPTSTSAAPTTTPEAPVPETPEATPPTRREQIQAATQQLNDQSAPGKTAIVQPFPDAEPDYYRFQHTTTDGKTVSGTYTYNDDTNTIENLSVGDKNAGLTNSVGPTGVRNILKDLQAAHPDLQGIDGYRISGARKATGAGPENVSVPVRPQTPEDSAQIAPVPAVEHLGDEVVQKLTKALNAAGKTRADQDAMYREARVARAAAIDAAGQGQKGEARLIAQKAAAKGELPKADFEDISQQFTSDERDSLLDKVHSAPNLRTYEKLRGQIALQKLLHGEVPQPSELGLLSKIFPTDFIRAAIKHKDTLAASFGKGDQNEMFKQGETLSSGPIQTLAPEPKPVDPNKFYRAKGQGDLFDTPPEAAPKLQGQGELFSGAETNSTGPVKGPLHPEAKPVDPDKYVLDKNQGDFFPDTREDADKIFPNRPSDSPKPAPIREAIKKNMIVEAANSLKALKATLDISAPGRQGLPLIMTKEYWVAAKDMLKQFGSEATFHAMQDQIKNSPNFERMKSSGLSITHVGEDLSEREEAFMSHLPEKIPGFGQLHKASERAYTGFLNQLRADTFNRILSQAKTAGQDIDDPTFLKDVSSVINNLTGRGDLGKFNQAAPQLNTVLFSPRFMMSRLQMLNPLYYRKLSPIARKEAIKGAVALGAVNLSVLGLAKLAGVNVTLNPTSTDFGKVNIKNPGGALGAAMTAPGLVGVGINTYNGETHYDAGAGILPIIRVLSILASGYKTTSGSGTVKLSDGFGGPTYSDVITSFIRSKLAPAIGVAIDLKTGKDFVGQPVTPAKELLSAPVPLSVNDAYEGYYPYSSQTPVKKSKTAPASTPTSSDNDIVSVTPVQ